MAKKCPSCASGMGCQKHRPVATGTGTINRPRINNRTTHRTTASGGINLIHNPGRPKERKSPMPPGPAEREKSIASGPFVSSSNSPQGRSQSTGFSDRSYPSPWSLQPSQHQQQNRNRKERKPFFEEELLILEESADPPKTIPAEYGFADEEGYTDDFKEKTTDKKGYLLVRTCTPTKSLTILATPTSDSVDPNLDVDKNFKGRPNRPQQLCLHLEELPEIEEMDDDYPTIHRQYPHGKMPILYLGKTGRVVFHEAMRTEIGETGNEQWPHRDEFHKFNHTSPAMARNYQGPFSPKLDIRKCAEPALEKWIYLFRRTKQPDGTISDVRWYAELFIDQQGNYHAVPLTKIEKGKEESHERDATVPIPEKSLKIKLEEVEPGRDTILDVENFALMSRDQLEMARIKELWEEVEHLGPNEHHPILVRVEPPEWNGNEEQQQTKGREPERTCQSFCEAKDLSKPIQLYLFDPWTELEYRCVELNAILSTCARFSEGLFKKALQDDYVFESDEPIPYGRRFTQWIDYSNPLSKQNLNLADAPYKNPVQECPPQRYKLILAVEEALDMNQYSLFDMKGSSREWYHKINRQEMSRDKTFLERVLKSLALHREYYGERMVQWLTTEPFLITLRQYGINREWFDICLHRFTDLTCLLENTHVGKQFLNKIGEDLFEWLREHEEQGAPEQNDDSLVDPATPFNPEQHQKAVLNKGVLMRLYLFFPTARRILFQYDAFSAMDQLYLHISNGFIQHRLIEMNKSNPMSPKQIADIRKSIQMMLEGTLDIIPKDLQQFFNDFWGSVQDIHKVSDWKFLLNNDGTAELDAKSFSSSKVFTKWYRQNFQQGDKSYGEKFFKHFDKFLLSVELFNFYQYFEALQQSGNLNELEWNSLYLFGAALDLANSMKFAHEWYGSVGTEFGKKMAKKNSGWVAGRFGRLLQKQWLTGTLAFVSTMIDISAAGREYMKAREKGEKALADAHMINIVGYIGLLGGIVTSGFTLTNPLSALLFWGSTGLVMIGHILINKNTQSDMEKWLSQTPWGGEMVTHYRYALQPEHKWDYSAKNTQQDQGMLDAYNRLLYDFEITVGPDDRSDYDEAWWESLRITIRPAYMEINDLLYLWLMVYNETVVFPVEADPYAAIALDEAVDPWEIPESWIHFQYGGDRKKRVSSYNGTEGVLLNYNPNVEIRYRTDSRGQRVGYESFSFTITRYIGDRELNPDVKKEFDGNGGPDRKQKGFHIYNYKKTREKCMKDDGDEKQQRAERQNRKIPGEKCAESPLWAGGRLKLNGVVTLKRMLRTTEKVGKCEEEVSDPIERCKIRMTREEEKVEKQVTNIDEWRPYHERFIPTWESREKSFDWPGKYPILTRNKQRF